MDRRPRLSVVIPVYNAAGVLGRLLGRLEPVLAEHASAWEVLLVDDGSRDGSWRVIEELAASRPWLRGIGLMRNFGQHNALLCGIRAAQHEIVVTMDDDLQHPPEEIPKLLEELGRGDFDVVYGSPSRPEHGLWRRIASRTTKLALSMTMGAGIATRVSAFRALRSELRRAFADYRGSFVSIDVLLTWATARFSAVPVRHEPRSEGVSNYRFRDLVAHALNMMTGFSIVPLQLASVTGFAFTLFGVGTLLYVLARYFLEGSSVPGFPFLASLIALFSGAQLFALGIIGEYLARVHFGSLGRPTYTIRATTRDS